MHRDLLADDKAIGNKLADGLARVGIGDLRSLIWVEPDLAFTASNDRGREALLSTKIHPADKMKIVSNGSAINSRVDRHEKRGIARHWTTGY